MHTSDAGVQQTFLNGYRWEGWYDELRTVTCGHCTGPGQCFSSPCSDVLSGHRRDARCRFPANAMSSQPSVLLKVCLPRSGYEAQHTVTDGSLAAQH